MLGNEAGSMSKLQVINERWQEIQISMEREKNYRMQSIEEQVAALDDRISHGKAFSQQKLNLLTQKTSKARQTLQEIEERKEQISQNVARRLSKTEETMAAELAAQRAGRQEYREGWIRKCDQKLLDVCSSMESLTNEKGQTVESTTVKIQNKLSELSVKIQQEKLRREEETRRVSDTVEEELNKLYTQLEYQKKSREQKGRKLEEYLKEIQNKLERQVQQERRLRKQTNAALLTLLEQTCIKVEQAFQ